MKILDTRYIKGIIGFAMLLGMGVPVTAGVVTPVVYFTQVCSPCVTGHSGAVSNAYGLASVGSVPSPFADVRATVDSSHGFSGTATVKYYFEYSGPSGSIPIDIAYSMLWEGDPDYSFSFLSIALSAGDNYAVPLTYNPGSHIGVLHGTVGTNQIYEVDLSASVGLYPNSIGVTAHARVDPVISIDPSFTGNPSDYSLILSDGVGNSETSATPEPGTGLLMAGLAVIAVLQRRRIARQRASDRT